MTRVLSTARLQGEPIGREHLADVCRFHQDADAMAHMGGAWDEAKSVAYVERHVAHWVKYGFGTWVVREHGGDDAIGLGGLHHLDLLGVDEVEVGYGFLPPHWGRGLATELATECVRVAREDVGLASVVACTSPDHAASIRVMQKSGFEFEREVTLPGGPAVIYRARLE
jgi:[ribosomal protein S5]-alanine N-acetyltransferase